VGVEGDLHAGDRRHHRHGRSRNHGAGGTRGAGTHGHRRPDQHRQHQEGAEALDRHRHRGREQDEQHEAGEAGPGARGGGAGRVEGDRGKGTMKCGQCRATEHEQERRRHEVAVRHAERIAEEELLEPLRSVRSEGEERAEADQAGDSDRGAGVRPDARVARRERDQGGGHERAAGGAEQERRAGEGREHQPREQPVGQGLGAVRQPLGHDPEPERAAQRADHRQLEQRPPVDAGAERIDEEVDHLHAITSSVPDLVRVAVLVVLHRHRAAALEHDQLVAVGGLQRLAVERRGRVAKPNLAPVEAQDEVV